MLTTKAAGRYAAALLELAQERNELEEVLEDIFLMHNTMEGSSELVNFLQSPIIKFDDKIAVLEKLFSDGIQDSTDKFMKLLARKDRIELLYQITADFIAQYKKLKGIITVDVVVAEELNKDQQIQLQKSIEKRVQKKVDLNVSIDETVRGGISVRIDDTVIDGTVKHQLEKLNERLHSTAAV